ncbi:MAG: hypothetical protein JXR76_28535 [Deltaproteobacteria bacterium]|nr:hypothetical protein [Deltaproteobacteria bacterium]
MYRVVVSLLIIACPLSLLADELAPSPYATAADDVKANADGMTSSKEAPSLAEPDEDVKNEAPIDAAEDTALETNSDNKKMPVAIPPASPQKAVENSIATHSLQSTDTDEEAAPLMTLEWGVTAGGASANSSAHHHSLPVDMRQVSRRPRRVQAHPVLWKNNTEWVSLGLGLSTYGASGWLSIATLRWRNVYWDTVKITGGAWKRTVHLFGSSLIGMPFWISARHEFRVGTGISVGYMRFRYPVNEGNIEFFGSGISAAKVKSYILLPLEASYVYHHKEKLAFQISVLLAFPMKYKVIYLSSQPVDPEDYEVNYRPFLSAYAGLRF